MYTNYADSTQFDCGVATSVHSWFYSYIAREYTSFDLAIGDHPYFANFRHAIARGWVLTVHGFFDTLNMDAEIQQLVEMVRNLPWYAN